MKQENQEVPLGSDYRGLSGIARESIWLTNEDLPHDRDTPVTIEKVVIRRNVKFQGGREKKVALSLKFVGKGRELVLNVTNRKTLGALFDDNACAAWWGKRIALFVQQDVRRPDGSVGPAVRIRAKLLPQDTACEIVDPEASQAPQNEQDSFDLAEEAMAAIQQAKTPEDLGKVLDWVGRSGFHKEELTELKDAALVREEEFEEDAARKES